MRPKLKKKNDDTVSTDGRAAIFVSIYFFTSEYMKDRIFELQGKIFLGNQFCLHVSPTI